MGLSLGQARSKDSFSYYSDNMCQQWRSKGAGWFKDHQRFSITEIEPRIDIPLTFRLTFLSLREGNVKLGTGDIKFVCTEPVTRTIKKN